MDFMAEENRKNKKLMLEFLDSDHNSDILYLTCDRMESGWTPPDRSGQKVMTNRHQTGLVWWEYLGVTRPVW